MGKRRIAIIGAGGFAQEVESLINSLDDYEFSGFYVSSSLYENDKTTGHIFSLKREIEENKIDCVVIGIGDPKVRQEQFNFINDKIPNVSWETLIHPSVMIDRRTSSIGEGSIVCAGTIITTNVSIGKNCVINLSSTVGHDAVIGCHSVINPSSNISGNVVIGEASLIGTGSAIIQKLKLGDFVTVGALACVTKNVESGKTVVGIPAREIKR